MRLFLELDKIILKFICHDNGQDVLKHFKRWVKEKKGVCEVGRFVNLKMGSSGVSTQAASSAKWRWKDRGKTGELWKKQIIWNKSFKSGSDNQILKIASQDSIPPN